MQCRCCPHFLKGVIGVPRMKFVVSRYVQTGTANGSLTQRTPLTPLCTSPAMITRLLPTTGGLKGTNSTCKSDRTSAFISSHIRLLRQLIYQLPTPDRGNRNQRRSGARLLIWRVSYINNRTDRPIITRYVVYLACVAVAISSFFGDVCR